MTRQSREPVSIFDTMLRPEVGSIVLYKGAPLMGTDAPGVRRPRPKKSHGQAIAAAAEVIKTIERIRK